MENLARRGKPDVARERLSVKNRLRVVLEHAGPFGGRPGLSQASAAAARVGEPSVGRPKPRRSLYSAVVGSITDMTSDTRSAGKPPCRACSRSISSLGAR